MDTLETIIEQSARIDLIHRNHRAAAYSNKVARKQLIKSRIMTALTLLIFCLLIITIGKVSAKDRHAKDAEASGKRKMHDIFQKKTKKD